MGKTYDLLKKVEQYQNGRYTAIMNKEKKEKDAVNKPSRITARDLTIILTTTLLFILSAVSFRTLSHIKNDIGKKMEGLDEISLQAGDLHKKMADINEKLRITEERYAEQKRIVEGLVESRKTLAYRLNLLYQNMDKSEKREE